MSKVVVIDCVPLEAELIGRNGQRWPFVNGGTVFYADAVRALMQYGTYDHYYFLKASASLSVSLPPNASILSPCHIGRLHEHDRVVFFTPTEQPGPLMGLRDALGLTRSPVISFLHAAEPGWFLQHYAHMLFHGPQSNDALVCSSSAGRAVFRQMQEMLKPSSVVGPELPLIRVGANTCRYHGRDRRGARVRYGCSDSSLCLLYFGRLEIFCKADLLPLLIMLAGEPELACVRLIIAGADTRANAPETMKSLAISLRVQNRVTIIPNPSLEEKDDLLSAADVFISPADGIHETFGLSLVEAASAGLPIIASDWSGYRDIVEHGATGFLVRTNWLELQGMTELLAPFDYYSPRTLATALSIDWGEVKEYLRVLIINPETRREMSERARQRAIATYDWSVIVPQYEALFDQLSLKPPSQIDNERPLYVQEVFGHYASRCIRSTVELREGPYLVFWEAGVLTDALRTEEPGSPEWFETEVAARVVEAVRSREFMSIDAIVQGLEAQSHLPTWILIRHIAKMVKFGILQYM